METVLSLALGVGLAAACGFRIFVPLTVMSLAIRAGHMEVAENFAWLGSRSALLVLGCATLLEVAAYYVPWVDNLLDLVASPAAVVAGILVTGSVITDVSPMLQWSLAAIAGGGAAGLVQAATTVARQVSAATTLGVGNPFISTLEAGGAVVMSALAVFVPLLALGAVLVLAVVAVRMVLRWREGRSAPAVPA